MLEDVNEPRRQSAIPVRDMRYYAERVRTAQLMPAPTSNEVVAFGHTVTFERDDGRTQTFRIVGEDGPTRLELPFRMARHLPSR